MIYLSSEASPQAFSPRTPFPFTNPFFANSHALLTRLYRGTYSIDARMQKPCSHLNHCLILARVSFSS